MQFVRQICSLAAVTFTLSACGQQQSSGLNEAWNRVNDPIVFSSDYNYTLSDLPLTGKSEKEPWSDTYWPSYKGGLADRWNDPDVDGGFDYELLGEDEIATMSLDDLKKLSPAEKYDLFVGNTNYSLVKHERQRTSPDNDSWWGLCHGWAPAAINFDEPKPVTIANAAGLEIPFGSADVKALLTFAQQYQRPRSATRFLGARCNRDLSTDPDAGELDECRDVNAGSFHVVLANHLGLMKQPFLADVTRDLQVWNQPIHSFESEVLSESTDIYDGAARGTVKIVTVATTMIYTVEVSAMWEALAGTHWGQTYNRPRDYQYTLEIDINGKIIGGEWLEGERPDFLWTQTAPNFSGYFKELQKIYEASVQ